MTVETTGRKTTQTMSISVVEYTFSFRALKTAPGDIKCKRTNSTTNVDEDMTRVTEIPSPSDASDVLSYLVSINTDGIGGTVTVCWPSTNSTITIYRETTDTQSSDYEDYNQFPAETVETDLDKRTLKSQEQQEDIARALKYGITAPTGSSLPSPVADTYLGWDSDGILLENKTIATGGTILVKASSAQALAKTENTTYITPYLLGEGIRSMGTIEVKTEATIAMAVVTNLTASAINIGSGSVIAQKTKAITVENPGGAEEISMWYEDQNITIESIQAVLEGTTPSVLWGMKHAASRTGSGTVIVTDTTTDVTSGATITSFEDATIPSKSHIWLYTAATSGTIDGINLTVKYRQDA